MGMTAPKMVKNVLLDSDDEKLPGKPKTEEPWKQNVRKYAILSKFQIEQLEMVFIKKRLKPTRNNIKSVSQDLKIPFKRALDYFNNRLKITDNRVLKYTKSGIEALENIDNRVETVWNDYMEFSRMIDEKNEHNETIGKADYEQVNKKEEKNTKKKSSEHSKNKRNN